jgi:hypothetical protein
MRFVHVASNETSDGHSPLADLVAFKQFQQDIADRYEEPPTFSELREIGSYRPPLEPRTR